MRKSAQATFLGLSAVLILITAAFAAVPQTINYQGYLKGSSGAPVNSATNMVFSLYSTTSGVRPVWGSGTVSITPVNGIYSVELGKSPQPALGIAFNRPYWLGVTAGTDPEMRPLQPLTSVPYALHAVESETVPDGSVTAAKLADSSVSAVKLADGSVTAAKLDTAYVKKTGDSMSGSLALPVNGLAVGTNQLVVNNGNVGIGTATPATRLSVASASGYLGDFSGGTWWGILRFLEGTTHRAYLGYGDSGGFLLNSLVDSTGLYALTGGLHLTANVDATKGITVTPTGNIGIGTTAPAARIHLKGGSYPDSFMFLDTSAAAQDSGLRFLENGTTKSQLYWSAANQTLRLLGSGASGLDITSTGSIGIGTATPSAKLSVSTTGGFISDFASTSTWGILRFLEGATTRTYLGYGDAGGFLTNSTPDSSGLRAVTGSLHLTANSDATKGITITSAGNAGMGTTTPAARFHLKGSSYPDSFIFLDTTAAAQDSGLRFLENGVTKSHLFWLASAQTLALRGSSYLGLDIAANGNVGVGTTAPAEKMHVWGDFLRVEGGGGEKAYIGGDGAGGDVQIGSMNAGITNVAMYNTATNTYMSVYLKNVHVMGGADLAEPFNSVDANKLEPGMVVTIDAENPGQLVLAEAAYDKKVAGIVSGANGISAGMTMSQEGTPASGSVPVALTGRVYAWADASHGAITPGDLLTTSDTPGHAMKVTDHGKAQGAIIGKAMSKLSEGKGLVLVLVTLQ